MRRVCPKLFTRTSTSFGYWILRVSPNVKYRILWWDDDVGVGVVEELATRDSEWHIAGYVAINSLAIFVEMWFLTAGPVVGIPMIPAELPEWKNCGSVFKKHNCHEQVPLFDIFSGFFCGSHLTVGRHHRRLTPCCPRGLQLSRVKVFFRINHKLSLVRLSCHFFCKREQCSLVVRFELVSTFGKIPSLALGTSLLSFSLFVRPILEFYSVGTPLMRNFDINFSQAMHLSFPDTRVTWGRLCESYPLNLFQDFLHRVSPKLFCSLRTSAPEPCETQPNCGTLFTIATAFLSSLSFLFGVALLGLFIWLFINRLMRKQTLVSSLNNPFHFYRIGTRSDANIHKAFACRYLSNNICTVVEEWTHGHFCLGYFSSSTHTSTSWYGWLRRCCGIVVWFFTWSLLSCRKLHRSPCEHWPFSFHW